jgi:hypothetical protein
MATPVTVDKSPIDFGDVGMSVCPSEYPPSDARIFADERAIEEGFYYAQTHRDLAANLDPDPEFSMGDSCHADPKSHVGMVPHLDAYTDALSPSANAHRNADIDAIAHCDAIASYGYTGCYCPCAPYSGPDSYHAYAASLGNLAHSDGCAPSAYT